MFDPNAFLTDRIHNIDASGIRRVFDLAAKLKNPVNLSIGQPDFDVPEPVKQAAIDAINAGKNSYTVTQGSADLIAKVNEQITSEFPDWTPAGKDSDGFGTLITSGVSGGLVLALMTCIEPGDEVLIPDPFFVMYKHLVTMAGGKAVYFNTYPDFQVTAERIEPYITERTKLLLFNSPSNPTGVVASPEVCKEVVELAEKHNILLVCDEIYDEFCYETVDRAGKPRCPSPASFGQNLLLLRGYSKTYGMTGWRLGYAVGPKTIVEQMTKLQQYTFVCAPSMVQAAGVAAMDIDMSSYIDSYRKKRDRVMKKLSGTFELTKPNGAFYAFPKVPDNLNMTGTEFVEKVIERGVLIIPGNVFSTRDTHFRISYACPDENLDKGLDVLLEIGQG